MIARLRVWLTGCPVCGKPAAWRAWGRGPQRHARFCRYGQWRPS